MYVAHKDTGAPLCLARLPKGKRYIAQGHTVVPVAPPNPAHDYLWDGSRWVESAESVQRGKRNAREKAYPSPGDQLGAISKDRDWQQMQAGKIRKSVEDADNISLSDPEFVRDALLDILSLFDAVEEMDGILTKIKQVKKDIPLP